MTRISTPEAVNHLHHAGFTAKQIPVGALVQFGPHKGDQLPYYFRLYRETETEWATSTSHYAEYGRNVIVAGEVSR